MLLILISLAAPCDIGTPHTSTWEEVDAEPQKKDDSTWKTAGTGGAVGAAAGLGAIVAYLVTVPGAHSEVVDALPLRGAEIFLAVPLGTTIGAVLGALVGETQAGDMQWGRIGAAGAGGVAAGTVGAVAALGAGVGTFFLVGSAVSAAASPEDRSGWAMPGLAEGMIAGVAVGSATMIALGFVGPSVAVTMTE